MAQKRMVSLKIIDTDLFLEMPSSTQNLYFHLIARADDDGFLGNSRKIMKIIGASEDDMKILFSKLLVIPFQSGVCVIKHWKIHNYIRSDRYTETIYKDEKDSLSEDHNRVYTPKNDSNDQNVIPDVIPTAYQLETQSRLDEININKSNIENKKESPFAGFKPAKSKPTKHKHGEYKHVLLTDEEYELLKDKVDNRDKWIKILDEAIETKGYKYKNHSLVIQKWYKKETPEDEIKNKDYAEGWDE